MFFYLFINVIIYVEKYSSCYVSQLITDNLHQLNSEIDLGLSQMFKAELSSKNK